MNVTAAVLYTAIIIGLFPSGYTEWVRINGADCLKMGGTVVVESSRNVITLRCMVTEQQLEDFFNPPPKKQPKPKQPESTEPIEDKNDKPGPGAPFVQTGKIHGTILVQRLLRGGVYLHRNCPARRHG